MERPEKRFRVSISQAIYPVFVYRIFKNMKTGKLEREPTLSQKRSRIWIQFKDKSWVAEHPSNLDGIALATARRQAKSMRAWPWPSHPTKQQLLAEAGYRPFEHKQGEDWEVIDEIETDNMTSHSEGELRSSDDSEPDV